MFAEVKLSLEAGNLSSIQKQTEPKEIARATGISCASCHRRILWNSSNGINARLTQPKFLFSRFGVTAVLGPVTMGLPQFS